MPYDSFWSEIDTHHKNGKLNPSDIFTKEMHDDINLHTIHNYVMISAEDFL